MGISRARIPPHRQPPHFPPVLRPGQAVLLFVTVCTENRKPILANHAAHQLLCEAWLRSLAWRVGRYVVMPDHLHLFCAPADAGVSLSHWMRFWKAHVSRRWPRPEEQPIWQRAFWDTQLRADEGYAVKWDYVRLNPVRKGLVRDPEEWPYAGEIEPLPLE